MSLTRRRPLTVSVFALAVALVAGLLASLAVPAEPAQAVPTIRVGEYLHLDGTKQSGHFFDANDVTVDGGR